MSIFNKFKFFVRTQHYEIFGDRGTIKGHTLCLPQQKQVAYKYKDNKQQNASTLC